MSARAYDPAAYGEACAAFYDQLYPTVDPRQVVALTALAGGGPVLELGLATGRVALRLARAGVPVHGVEVSPAMLAAFAGRQAGATHRVRVVPGDFVEARCGGPFTLVFALVDTLALLPDGERRLRCLRNVAAHLRPRGLFVEESFEEGDTPPGETREHTLRLAGGERHYAVRLWPLGAPAADALARAAGLELVERWSGWGRAPWRPGDLPRVSVYRRVPVVPDTASLA